MAASQPPPDFMTQVRQWIGLIIALGGMAYLVHAGMAVGRIEEKVTQNSDRAKLVGKRVTEHIKMSDQGFRDVARLVKDLDSRTSRLEGRQEERDHAPQTRRN